MRTNLHFLRMIINCLFKPNTVGFVIKRDTKGEDKTIMKFQNGSRIELLHCKDNIRGNRSKQVEVITNE